MASLAPIVLFAYNRPDHVTQTLQALKKNSLADQSTLYIYCDGPKEGSSISEIDRIDQVRSIIRSDQWCKVIHIVERKKNIGLAQSIVTGVTEIINTHGKIIVLEDDIVTSPGFLSYMNEALNLYQSVSQVMHISGYMFPIETKDISYNTFFLKLGTCWGWATWADKWEKLNTDTKSSFKSVTSLSNSQIKKFDYKNNSLRLLRNTMLGHKDSWAIKWYATIFLNDGLGLHPKLSLVQNIGFDGSGTNYFNPFKKKSKTTEYLNPNRIALKNNFKIEKRLKSFFFYQRLASAPQFYLNKFKWRN